MTSSFGRVSSFGQRAEMERRGMVPLESDDPAAKEPVPAETPRSRSNLEILVTPILDREAMVAIADEVTATIRDAFQRGFTEGIAEAERELGVNGT
jgi:hypothetical protein